MEPPLPDAQKVAALRDALPATGAGIYLDTATRGPLPAETAAAMREADEWELRVGRVGVDREHDVAQRAAEARAVLAALVTADVDAIAIFPGLEAALAAALRAPDLASGDRILTTSDESAGVYAALAAVRGLGAEIDVADPGEPPSGESLLQDLRRAMTPRTRLIVVSHVTAGTGLLVPLDECAALARETGAWLVVDASRSAGAIPLAAPATGADFVCLATDAWALGPEGTAGMWIGPRALRTERPPVTATAGFETLTASAARPWPDARRFEPAAMPRTTLLGLARSVGWLQMYVGLEWAHDRAATLAARLHQALTDLPGVEVVTPRGEMATIVTFRVAGWRAEQTADELGRRVFALLRALPEREAVRASVAWFNTEDELDRFAEAVGELGRHSPDSLPRRPSLVVLPQDRVGQPE